MKSFAGNANKTTNTVDYHTRKIDARKHSHNSYLDIILNLITPDERCSQNKMAPMSPLRKNNTRQ